MEKVWKTKNGKAIPIEKMTNKHLINILKMFKNRGFVGIKTLNFYLNCRGPQGEYAWDAFEQELLKIFDKKPCHEMDWIEEELKKRKIKF